MSVLPESVNGPRVGRSIGGIIVPELSLEKGASRRVEAAGSFVVGLTAQRAIGGASVNGSQHTRAELHCAQGEHAHRRKERHYA